MNNTLSITYPATSEFTSHLAGKEIRYISKPGLPLWDQITPSERLLAENINPIPETRVLMLGCRHGAAGAAIAAKQPLSQIDIVDHNYIAVQMASKTAKANHLSNLKVCADISLRPEQYYSYQIAALDLPKGRKLARRWLVQAYDALADGGYLFLAGAKKAGINSIIKDARDLFTSSSLLGYKKGSRVVRFTKDKTQRNDCQWFHDPGVQPNSWVKIDLVTHHGEFHLHSLPGVFSYDRLDDGTNLLLSTFDNFSGERVLDLGCGYGVIGLIAAKTKAEQVDLVDSNLLAIAAAQNNLEKYGRSKDTSYPSDVLSAVSHKTYHRILSNPPFHSGVSVDYQIAQAFIQQSWQALESGGSLVLVANKFIRYDRLMEEFFNKVTLVKDTNRFRVWSGKK